jgi:hypothetical protein
MIYNLSPIFRFLMPENANSQIWRDRITSFFKNEEYDAELQDQYYDILINSPLEVDFFLNKGILVDEYTGLFSLPSPYIEGKHTFNLAYFISRNYQHFYNKKILTVSADFGILNIQAKLCGLNIVSSIQREFLNAGTVLACIGNNCPPYPINKFDFEEEDVVIMSCVFEDIDLAYKNWEFMLDKRLDGKEVFFSSNTFFHLKDYINYDRIELINDPDKEYRPEDYAELTYGYTNKIYRLK